jgi:methylmalonyl-CoA/ethylmalonyl-CoA epimerase
MSVNLGPLRQIALPAHDLSESVKFYQETLGVEFIARYDPPGMAFFRLGDTRLLLEQSTSAAPSRAVLYFHVADIHAAYVTLKEKGVRFDSEPHLIYRDDKGVFGPVGGEEWMVFFKDPDGNVLALASRKAGSD